MADQPFARQLGIQYPILQAPIGSMAGVELAAAVSNAGGLGSLAITWTSPDAARQLVADLRALTAYPFFVNFVLAFEPRSLDAALEAGAPLVTFSWGQPGGLVERVHRSNALVGVQVGTAEGARIAQDSGADFVICQGIEAGGHVQSTRPLSVLLAEVVAACGDLPVIAAGGLADGEDIAGALAAGAQAVMLGTRFVATVESRAHPVYKQALVEAQREHTALTVCFSGGWPNAPHRVLRNSTLQAWEAAGCPSAGARPGEGEQVAARPSGKPIMRYDYTAAANDMTGDVAACVQYAGLGCHKIRDIPAVRDLLPAVWADCLLASDSSTGRLAGS
jgi:NAD(P)H-dependent flavin oxidoreductase YrpB (nitropropane dioxygenase family)